MVFNRPASYCRNGEKVTMIHESGNDEVLITHEVNAPTPNFIVIQVDQTCPDWVVTVGPQVVGPATMSGDLLHTNG